MNFATKTIEKCVIEGEIKVMEWDKIRNYYYEIYPSIIDQLEKEADLPV